MKALLPFIKYTNPWEVLVRDWNLPHSADRIVVHLESFKDKKGIFDPLHFSEDSVLKDTINDLSQSSGTRRNLLMHVIWHWVYSKSDDPRCEIIYELSCLLDNRELSQLSFIMLASP